MLHVKRIIRRWVASWYHHTNSWVVPDVVWNLIDEGNYTLAAKMLEDAQEQYTSDPIITKAWVLIKRHSIIGR